MQQGVDQILQQVAYRPSNRGFEKDPSSVLLSWNFKHKYWIFKYNFLLPKLLQ